MRQSASEVAAISSPWVDAAITLGRDPTARVVCPACERGVLEVHDVHPPHGAAVIERTIECPVCDKRHVMRLSAHGMPPSVAERHPELVAVGEALAQRRRGEPVTARCHFCGEPLVIDDVVEVGVTVVRCERGDTWIRFRKQP